MGSLLGPTLSSRVSDVYFPELMDEERAKCRALGLLHPDATRYRLWQMCVTLPVRHPACASVLYSIVQYSTNLPDSTVERSTVEYNTSAESRPVVGTQMHPGAGGVVGGVGAL